MIKKNNIYIKALLLLFTVVMSLPTVFAQEGSGNWKGSQTGRQSSLYVPAADINGEHDNTAVGKTDPENSDPNPDNNTSTVIVTLDCEDEVIFSEDFGISDINNGNKGRVESSHMPINSFKFGRSYLQLPTPGGEPWDDNPIRSEARINDEHYAVVAPEFINDGWFPDDGWDSWWPPAEKNGYQIVSDHTGNSNTATHKGAVMAINAGKVLAPFYENSVTVEPATLYKASFWFYLLPGEQPTRIALDIFDPATNQLLGTVETALMGGSEAPSYIGKWTEHKLYFLTGGCSMEKVKFSLRNGYAATQGNDYFIDDIRLVKWSCDIEEDFYVEINCPKPVATPDINQTPENTPVSGKVLTNDNGEDIKVTEIVITDGSGNSKTVAVPTTGTVTEDVYVLDENGDPVKAGTLTIGSNGEYTFTPEKDFIGNVPMEYTIENNDKQTDTTSLTIEVIPNAHSKDNNLPIAQDDAYTTLAEKPITSNILSNDSDADAGDTITVTGATQGGTAISLGSSTQVSGVDIDGQPVANAGTVTINADGTIVFIPAPGFVGAIDPINYTIADSDGETDEANIYLNVIPEVSWNTTFANDDANTGKKGETLTGNVITNDNDPEGDTQTLTSVRINGTDYLITSGKTIVIPGSGILTMNPDGSYTFEPDDSFVGTVVVEQTVCDNGTPKACDKATLYLTTVDYYDCEEEVFFDDFGTSDLNDGNFGRTTSLYMPSNSFKFGTAYPTSTSYDEYMIDNNYYAVVAPGYIKEGTDPNQYYFWTPSYTDPNTVTDRSGTEEGAVLVINAGETLLPFYHRETSLESNTTYKASFWMYLVNGPSKVAIDIINKTTGEVLGTVESEMMEDWNTTYKGKWVQHELYFSTPIITPECNLDELFISIRNAHAATQGNDYFIDDIKLSKMVCDIPTTGVVEIKCPDPVKPVATPDINQTPVNTPVDGNILINDNGEDIKVTDIVITDGNGNSKTVAVPTTGTVTEDVYVNENGTPVKAGTITIDSNGDYTFTPEKGYTGNVPMEYTITDKYEQTDTTSLTIEVIPSPNLSDNNPPIAQDDAYTTVMGSPIISNILSNDSDPDGNTLSVTEAKHTVTNEWGGNENTFVFDTPTQVSGIDADGNPVHNAGTVTIKADGTIIFEPEYGFVGEINPINYTISDGEGGTDDANIYLNVLPDTGVNTTFANDDANTGKKGETLTGNVLDNDNDPEGDTQALTSVKIDGTVTLVTSLTTITIPGKGELKIGEEGAYTFVPESSFVGTVVVEQTVCDDGTPQACDTATLYLTTLGTKNSLLITNPMIRQRMK